MLSYAYSCAGGQHLLESVTQRAIVSALKSTHFSLTFPRFHQVFQTALPFDGEFSALGAATLARAPELIFALTGNWQERELILNPGPGSLGTRELMF
jgi:hypothetical protein